MCRESLRLYLSEKLGDDNRKEKILNLLLDKKEHDFDYKNDRADLNPYKAHLVEALDNLKLLDPACGSGAFPIGMLQIILATYARLDGRLDSYKTKKGIISENIYGVDIEPTAIEISRLRAWLSLIVDIELKASADNSGVEPLPNLDFKFICANSLIPLKVNSQLSLYDDVGFEKSLKFFQEQYFNTKLASEKKKLQVEFKKLLGENVLNSSKNGISERQKQLKTYQPFDSESVCGFFDTHFMFTLDGFDIVIGNPPYVQLQKLKKNPLQKIYKDISYLTYDSGGDLYCLFYEHAINLLKANAHLSYITSNKWMRANYGQKLRNLFIKQNPIELIDLGPSIFESATVDTNILFLQKKINPAINLSAVSYRKSDISFSTFIKNNSISLKKLNSDPWFIGGDAEQKLKEKIEKLGKPLRDWNIKINYGVKTGLNEAFIIDTKTKEKLCKEDPKSIKILQQILRGKDITKYSYQWADLWLINSNYDTDIPKQFPAVYKHLLAFKNRAEQREDQGQNWWNLRACAYYENFSKEKIIWQEMSQQASFAYDQNGIFCIDTARICTGEHIKLLLGLFNSHFFLYTFSKWYAGGGLGSKGIRFKSEFIKSYPIPCITDNNQVITQNIENLVGKILITIEKKDYYQNKQLQLEVNNFEAEIDNLIYQLYELTPEEINLIEESTMENSAENFKTNHQHSRLKLQKT
jgi:methylase of polypeptide subunit release factors